MVTTVHRRALRVVRVKCAIHGTVSVWGACAQLDSRDQTANNVSTLNLNHSLTPL